MLMPLLLPSSSVAGFTIGFLKGWKLALVMLSIFPLLALSAGLLFLAIGKLTSLGQKLYAEVSRLHTPTLLQTRSPLPSSYQTKN